MPLPAQLAGLRSAVRWRRACARPLSARHSGLKQRRPSVPRRTGLSARAVSDEPGTGLEQCMARLAALRVQVAAQPLRRPPTSSARVGCGFERSCYSFTKYRRRSGDRSCSGCALCCHWCRGAAMKPHIGPSWSMAHRLLRARPRALRVYRLALTSPRCSAVSQMQERRALRRRTCHPPFVPPIPAPFIARPLLTHPVRDAAPLPRSTRRIAPMQQIVPTKLCKLWLDRM